ncbi:sulfatase-like hydrolase/transferase [Luteolibacter pohnpeiensis]|uniref:Sulfatase-like hydrolase/transferase n=1 Tax=Luteolibacter pohnpeiensis TaxID=454153 RepID=A0A934S4L3_9BACT|nr:sulfatase-like hydrolase/transferase [Luteolibacter pohnpeiensis]MBK1881803.1 sulfatase-like hydrolase/transferase [Luteolibacter pohnpeiensis]
MLRIPTFLSLLFLAPLPAFSAEKPNVLLVFVDDMGWGDFSCFGDKTVQTQNIDQMAKEGVRFEQFYVNSPICSPSRTAITTGQYPQRWKISSYLSNREDNKRRGMAQWLDLKAPVLAGILHKAGYTTGHFGKWHMGGQRDVGEAPLIAEYGFDKTLTNFEGLGPRVLPLLNAFDGKPPKRYDLGSASLGHGPITWKDRSLVTQSFTSAALDFIKDAEKKDQPFYVNLWPDDVHSPFFPPSDRRGDGSKRQLFHGVLDTMDEQFAPIFDYIRNDEKLRNNTLVVICSDNGPEPGAGSAGPFRGHKGELFEGGVRSSLIAWGPKFIPADKQGTTNTSSVFAAIDFAPTILKITGTPVPDEVKYDGEALPDILLGKSDASRSAPLFFRRPPDRPGPKNARLPDLSVRDGDWKLLCQYDGSKPKLFSMKNDREETKNVAEKHPKIVKELTEKVLAWNATMPTDNGPELGKN